MAMYDQIPNIQKGKEFPIGDITDPSLDKAVNDFFDYVSSMSHLTFINYVESKSMALFSQSTDGTERAAAGLCHKWDYSYNNGRHFTTEGYRFVSVFNNVTKYLPKNNVSLKDDLERMTLLESQGGRISSGRAFGRVAWNSMAIYPNVHLTFLRLLEFAEPRYGIFVNKDRECLKTGMALPFMMSWASSLAESTPDFTCMVAAEEDIDINNFSNYLSVNVPLAPGNIHERNK